MLLRIEKEKVTHTRKSKLGVEHTYTRIRSVVVFRCDNCDAIFSRLQGKMDPKRLNNNYFHVCSNCDAKRFAQRKGIERNQIWDQPASSTKPIGRS